MSQGAMFEIIAAIIGASASSAMATAFAASGRARENREVVIRLTIGMEQVAKRLETLHDDIKADRAEMFARIAALEQSMARLQVRIGE